MNKIIKIAFLKRAISLNKLKSISNTIPRLLRAKLNLTDRGLLAPFRKSKGGVSASTILSTHKDIPGILKRLPNKERKVQETILKATLPEFKHIRSGDILISGNFIEDVPKNTDMRKIYEGLSDSAKEVVNRAVRMHEAFERRAIKETSKRRLGDVSFSGHSSPSVILRENNLVESLPKEIKDEVKSFFSAARNYDSSKQVLRNISSKLNVLGDLKRRYSRHAIKRIEEILNKKRTKEFQKWNDLLKDA